MRYELFLIRLPKLEPDDIKTKLGDLPASGLSVGILKKALQDKKLPTIAVGWSDDLAAVRKIQQRLTSLDGAVRVQDHASVIQKAWSAVEGVFDTGFSAVGSKVDEQAKKLAQAKAKAKAAATKAKPGSKAVLEESTGWVSALFMFLLKLSFGLSLYSAYAMSSATGNVATVEWLGPRLVAVSVGVVCMHVATLAVSAALVQRVTLYVAAPAVIVPLTVLAFAIVKLDAQPQAEAVVARNDTPKQDDEVQLDWPPPVSRPYQGLIEELRLRKLRDSERVLQEVEDAPGAGELPAGVKVPKAAKPQEDKTASAKPEETPALAAAATPPPAAEASAPAQAAAPAQPQPTAAGAPASATQTKPDAKPAPAKPEAKQPAAKKTAKAPSKAARAKVKPRPPALGAELDVDSLAAIALVIWIVTLVVLLWLRVRERRRYQLQAAQIVVTFDAKLAQAQTTLQSELEQAKAALESQSAERELLDRELAEAAAAREQLDRKLAAAVAEREALDRELARLRAEKAREGEREDEREAEPVRKPRADAANAAARRAREDEPARKAREDDAARKAREDDAARKAREDDPMRSAITRKGARGELPGARVRAALLGKPTVVDPGGDDERAFTRADDKPVPQPPSAHKPEPARPRAEEQAAPRSSYAVRDVQEERIAIPKQRSK